MKHLKATSQQQAQRYKQKLKLVPLNTEFLSRDERADGLGWNQFQENKVMEKSLFFLCRQMGNGAELREHITLSGPDVPWQRGTRLNSGFSTLLTIAPTPWRSGLSPSRRQSKGSFSDAFMLKTKSIPWGLINGSARNLFGQTERGTFVSCLLQVLPRESLPSCKWNCTLNINQGGERCYWEYTSVMSPRAADGRNKLNQGLFWSGYKEQIRVGGMLECCGVVVVGGVLWNLARFP